MKISKKKSAVLLAAAAMLLGGCGDAPYELTESEEAIIVNYSARIVAKFNTKQRDGLKYVKLASETVEDGEEVAEEVPEDSQTPEDSENTGNAESVSTEEYEPSQQTAMASLQELFGNDTFELTCLGTQFSDNYVENDVYAMNADAGNCYLEVKIAVCNNSSEEAVYDNLTLSPAFSVSLSNGTRAEAEITVLSTDFSTYEGAIPAGETVETVLLFEVPETADIDGFALYVTLNGDNYQIIL